MTDVPEQGCGGCDCFAVLTSAERCKNRREKASRECWCPKGGVAWIGLERETGFDSKECQ